MTMPLRTLTSVSFAVGASLPTTSCLWHFRNARGVMPVIDAHCLSLALTFEPVIGWLREKHLSNYLFIYLFESSHS